MVMNRWSKAGVMALSILALGAAGAMADAKGDAVKSRRDDMKALAAANKTINDYVKGKADKAAAAKAADTLGATSTKLAKLWPKGTSSAELPGTTAAKPAIWTDMAKFNASFSSLSDGAKKLGGTINSGTTDDVKAAAAALAKANCAGCHSTYRETEAPKS